MSDQSQGYGWWSASDGRWYPPESHPDYRPASIPFPKHSNPLIKWWIGIGIALLAVLATAAVVAIRVVSDFSRAGDVQYASRSVVPDGGGDAPVRGGPSLPTAILTVHSDGCGVIRSHLPDEPHGLTWSVVDEDGFEVLGRNAANETRYRYFQSGTYQVVLTAFDGTKYVPISNTVTIHC